jgi:hypothetical protein
MPENETAIEWDFVWLIESDLGGSPSYWNGSSLSPDHDCAVRFARKEDAQRVIDGGRAGSVLGSTVAPMCKAVEHGWMKAPAAAEEKQA